MYVLVLAAFFCRQYTNKLEPAMTLQEYATPERVTQLRLQMPKLIERLQQEQEAGRG
jgi:hypothetical protein